MTRRGGLHSLGLRCWYGSSAVHFPDILAITKPARLYVSRPILEEYGDVLGRLELRIRKGLRQQLLQLIKSSYTVVPTRRLEVTHDPPRSRERLAPWFMAWSGRSPTVFEAPRGAEALWGVPIPSKRDVRYHFPR